MELPSFRTTLRRLSKKQLFRAYVSFLVGTTLLSGLYFAIPLFRAEAPQQLKSLSELKALPIVVPTERYGFALDTFQVFENQIQSGTFLGDILLKFNLDYPSIEKLVKNAKGTFDVRHFRPGKPYTVLTKDSTQRADYFIYEPSAYEYIVFHLDSLKVEKVEREITTEVRTASGKIPQGGSLWKTMATQNLSAALADKMEDALQWSLDFTRLQAGDEFRLVYEQNFIEGQQVGIGRVQAAYYKTGDKEFHAIYFNNGDKDVAGYYDLKGRPMKGSFLKAPVRASRISSYYNLNRLHPILKYRRPHYGTDYAAPYGTEILAVGNGVVQEASYTNGNGNYVKIRHDGTYQTQYLHMQRFAKGIRPGAHVQQGQVIGYVGATGLATGPHVCFRFWKNGQQVNHLNMTFPPAAPLSDELMPEFNLLKENYLDMLNSVIQQAPEAETAEASDSRGGLPVAGQP